MNLPKKIKYCQVILSTWYQYMLIKASLNSNKPLNKPTSIIFNLTPNCVLKCRQCDIWKNPPEKHISYDEAKIIIDKLHSWLGNCYIFFTGGEPLMNKDLPKIIGYAYSQGTISHINSNATLIDENMAKKLVDNHLFAISISLDGANSKTHDYLRGMSKTFSKAINAIKYLQKYPQSPKIFINTVMMKNNTSELLDIVKLAKKHRTDGITFQSLLPNLGPNTVDNTQPDKNPLWPNTKDIVKNIKKIINLSKTDSIILSSEEDLQTDIGYYQNYHSLDHLTCAAGINNFIIDHLGNVRLCFGFPAIGNILKETPPNIWFSPKAQSQREAIRKCQQSCKIIGCNRANTKRNHTVAGF